MPFDKFFYLNIQLIKMNKQVNKEKNLAPSESL